MSYPSQTHAPSDGAFYTLADGARVSIAPPTVDDAAEALTYLDAVRRETQFIGWSPLDTLPTLEKEQAWLREVSEDPLVLVLAARVEGKIIALADVTACGRFHRMRHTAVLGISILQAWCGRGVGALLMQELVGWSQRHPDIDVIRLYVTAGNARAQALYHRCGFEVEGRRRWTMRREDGSYVDDIVMARWVGHAPPAEHAFAGSTS